MTKTSIRNIDQDMLWDAKIYAAQTQQTMGQVVTEALDLLLTEHETRIIECENTEQNF